MPEQIPPGSFRALAGPAEAEQPAVAEQEEVGGVHKLTLCSIFWSSLYWALRNTLLPLDYILTKFTHIVKVDVEVHKLLFLLLFQLSMFCALKTLSRIEGVIYVWHWQQLWSMTLAMHGLKRVHGRRPRQLWAHDRGLRKHGLLDQNLLESFNAREFKGRMCMKVLKFEFLCSSLATFLQRHDTNMRYVVPVQIKVVVAIFRLATNNSMWSIADLYMIGLSTSQLAISQFNTAVIILVLKKFIIWPSTAIMDKFAEEF